MASSEPDLHAGTKRFVDRWCDSLASVDVNWAAASEPTNRYNCFGFAVGRAAWWQAPIFIDGIRANPTHHWPAGVADDGSVDAYVHAAELEGFASVGGGEWREGFEIIAPYSTERAIASSPTRRGRHRPASGQASSAAFPTSNTPPTVWTVSSTARDACIWRGR